MADIFFKCPECDGQLVVDDRGVGLQLPCPFCAKPVTIPQDAVPGDDSANVNGVSLEQSKKEEESPSSQTDAVPTPTAPATDPPNTNLAATHGEAAAPGTEVPSTTTGGEPEDPTADLEWDEEPEVDTIEAGKVENKEEIRRLAAMMNPEDTGLAVDDDRKGPLSFRCPSCGQVLATKRAQPGDRVRCKECESEFTVPEGKNLIEPRGLGTPRPSRGELPSGRNRLLRTADDIRKAQAAHQAMATGQPVPGTEQAPASQAKTETLPAPNSTDAGSVLTPEVQALLLKELQRIQAAQSKAAPAAPAPAPKTAPSSPAPKVRRRPLPPLAQHGEVVPVSAPEKAPQSEPAPRRESRVRPTQESLPPLVTMDTMDLDSEVARQWGEAAVVPTKTLNWVAWIIILWVLGVGGYFGYHLFDDWKKAQEAARALEEQKDTEEQPSQQEIKARENEETLKRLIAFHEANTAEEKAAFVRHAETVLPLMQAYYKYNDPEPRRLKLDSIKYESNTFDDRLFRTVLGDYQEGAAQINPDRSFLSFEANFEATQDGNYLLDWLSWVGHNEVPLDTFAKKGMTTPQVFRLWVRETNYRRAPYDDASIYTGYLLEDKREIDRIYGYTEKGTPASERLITLFSELKKKSEKKPKVRLMLSLRFAPEVDVANGQVLIDEFIGADWVESPEAP